MQVSQPVIVTTPNLSSDDGSGARGRRGGPSSGAGGGGGGGGGSVAGGSVAADSLASGGFANHQLGGFERGFFLAVYSMLSKNAARDVMSVLGFIIEPFQLSAFCFQEPHFQASIQGSWFARALSSVSISISTVFRQSTYTEATTGFWSCVGITLCVLATIAYVSFRLQFTTTSPTRALQFLRVVVMLLIYYFFLPVLKALAVFMFPFKGDSGEMQLADFPALPVNFGLVTGAWITFALFCAVSIPISLITVDVEGFTGKMHGRAEALLLLCKVLLIVVCALVPLLGKIFVFAKIFIAVIMIYFMLTLLPYNAMKTNQMRMMTLTAFLWVTIIDGLATSGLAGRAIADLLLMGVIPAAALGAYLAWHRWRSVVWSLPPWQHLVRMMNVTRYEPVLEDRIRLHTPTDLDIAVRHYFGQGTYGYVNGFVRGRHLHGGAGGVFAVLGLSSARNKLSWESAYSDMDSTIEFVDDDGSLRQVGAPLTDQERVRIASWLYKRCIPIMGESSRFWVGYYNMQHFAGAMPERISKKSLSRVNTFDLRFTLFRYYFEKRRSEVGIGQGTVKFLDFDKTKENAERHHRNATLQLHQLWQTLATGGNNPERFLPALHELGEAVEAANAAFQNLLRKHDYSTSVLRNYGQFLREVMHDHEAAQYYLNRADSLEQDEARDRALSFGRRSAHVNASAMGRLTSQPSFVRTDSKGSSHFGNPSPGMAHTESNDSPAQDARRVGFVDASRQVSPHSTAVVIVAKEATASQEADQWGQRQPSGSEASLPRVTTAEPSDRPSSGNQSNPSGDDDEGMVVEPVEAMEAPGSDTRARKNSDSTDSLLQSLGSDHGAAAAGDEDKDKDEDEDGDTKRDLHRRNAPRVATDMSDTVSSNGAVAESGALSGGRLAGHPNPLEGATPTAIPDAGRLSPFESAVAAVAGGGTAKGRLRRVANPGTPPASASRPGAHKILAKSAHGHDGGSSLHQRRASGSQGGASSFLFGNGSHGDHHRAVNKSWYRTYRRLGSAGSGSRSVKSWNQGEIANPRPYRGIRRLRLRNMLMVLFCTIGLIAPFVINVVLTDAVKRRYFVTQSALRRELLLRQAGSLMAAKEGGRDQWYYDATNMEQVPLAEITAELRAVHQHLVFCAEPVSAADNADFSQYLSSDEIRCDTRRGALQSSPTGAVVTVMGDTQQQSLKSEDGTVRPLSELLKRVNLEMPMDDAVHQLMYDMLDLSSRTQLITGRMSAAEWLLGCNNKFMDVLTIMQKCPGVSEADVASGDVLMRKLNPKEYKFYEWQVVRLPYIDGSDVSLYTFDACTEFTGNASVPTAAEAPPVLGYGDPVMGRLTYKNCSVILDSVFSIQGILYNVQSVAEAAGNGTRLMQAELEDTDSAFFTALTLVVVVSLTLFVTAPFFMMQSLSHALFEVMAGYYLLAAIPKEIVDAILEAENSDDSEADVVVTGSWVAGKTIANKPRTPSHSALHKAGSKQQLLDLPSPNDGSDDMQQPGDSGGALHGGGSGSGSGSARRGSNHHNDSARSAEEEDPRHSTATKAIEKAKVRTRSVMWQVLQRVRHEASNNDDRRLAPHGCGRWLPCCFHTPPLSQVAPGGPPGVGPAPSPKAASTPGVPGSARRLLRSTGSFKMGPAINPKGCCGGWFNQYTRDPIQRVASGLMQRTTMEPEFKAIKMRLSVVAALVLVAMTAVAITVPILYSRGAQLAREFKLMQEYVRLLMDLQLEWEVNEAKGFGPISRSFGYAAQPTWANYMHRDLLFGIQPWAFEGTNYNSEARIVADALRLSELHRCVVYGCEELGVGGISTSRDIANFYFGNGDLDDVMKSWINDARNSFLAFPTFARMPHVGFTRTIPRLFTENYVHWVGYYLTLLTIFVSIELALVLTVFIYLHRHYVVGYKRYVRTMRLLLLWVPDHVLMRVPFAVSWLHGSSWVESSNNAPAIPTTSEADAF